LANKLSNGHLVIRTTAIRSISELITLDNTRVKRSRFPDNFLI